MPNAFEILTGRVVNPGAVITPVTLATGDSLAVRSFPMTNIAYLDNFWALGTTPGVMRVRSPRIHDNVQGIRAGYTTLAPQPALPVPIFQPLYPQDVLIAEMSGGAAETDIMSMLVYYRDLPGVNARLYRWEELKGRVANILTVETQHTTGATIGDYGGALAINANFDLLQANVDYAILGYDTSVSVQAVGYRGPDFGNLRVGGPGTTQRLETRDWFMELDLWHDDPYIPVINAANKGSTFVDVVHNAAAVSVTVQTVLAQLKPV